jgi:hypothetical protein
MRRCVLPVASWAWQDTWFRQHSEPAQADSNSRVHRKSRRLRVLEFDIEHRGLLVVQLIRLQSPVEEPLLDGPIGFSPPVQ